MGGTPAGPGVAYYEDAPEGGGRVSIHAGAEVAAQDRTMQSAPQPGFGPCREPAMRGGGRVPNVGRMCRQAHPLVSTYTTAVNTARSSQELSHHLAGEA